MRQVTPYILGLLLLTTACGQLENNEHNSDSLGNTDNDNVNIQMTLSGQVYFYAPELDTITCKATGACDCCSGNIIFLNDSNFVSVDYCESGTSYSKGKYHLDNGNLVITSDSLYVSKDYNPAKEADTTGTVFPEYLVSDTMTATLTQTLKRIQCKNVICFLMGDKETYYVTPDNESKIGDFVNKLKDDKIWDRLKITKYR